MSQTTLDHLVIIAPSLAAGVAHVEDMLGVTPGAGGEHPLMGTHNRLIQLGNDVFLEVLAINPAAPTPSHARWFGLDDQQRLRRDWDEGRRLRAYVARTPRLSEHLAREAPVLGAVTRASRGDLVWHFGVTADGALPLDGAAPYLMDWGLIGPQAARMAEAGLKLNQLIVETPAIAVASALIDRLDMCARPTLRSGQVIRLLAVIDTPAGPRLLC
ncbi:VOC family protein [Candidatus Raskinella chloraquaticus]|uniref:Glyoxalase-like domain-containing protein n=1 Tax=Candidatus Raskinella chloraquaticus TaxID=1951219 RepID=A0A1W9HWV9_9HYPH|nr:MAG: hypothetical protein A4S15_10780 [Proteobacteria bacterium SG_bin8]